MGTACGTPRPKSRGFTASRAKSAKMLPGNILSLKSVQIPKLAKPDLVAPAAKRSKSPSSPLPAVT